VSTRAASAYPVRSLNGGRVPERFFIDTSPFPCAGIGILPYTSGCISTWVFEFLAFWEDL